jgi:hypothetical protein
VCLWFCHCPTRKFYLCKHHVLWGRQSLSSLTTWILGTNFLFIFLMANRLCSFHSALLNSSYMSVSQARFACACCSTFHALCRAGASSVLPFE